MGPTNTRVLWPKAAKTLVIINIHFQHEIMTYARCIWEGGERLTVYWVHGDRPVR